MLKRRTAYIERQREVGLRALDLRHDRGNEALEIGVAVHELGVREAPLQAFDQRLRIVAEIDGADAACC
jgi:hypothetical protein